MITSRVSIISNISIKHKANETVGTYILFDRRHIGCKWRHILYNIYNNKVINNSTSPYNYLMIIVYCSEYHTTDYNFEEAVISTNRGC